MYTLGIPDRQKRRTLGYLKQQYVDFEENPSMEGFFDVSFPGMDEDAFRNIVMKLKQQGVTTIGADEELTERKIMKLTDLITEAPTLEEMENNPLLNALKNTLQSWSTKQYPDDKTKAEEFILDIKELIEDFEEEASMRGIAVDAPDRLQEQKEQKLRELIRRTIRQ
jgi:molecular chaperone DnaK (HSP70)|tara:strand:+ start:44 stop:544 length:501 start_codon:yes stop_codon:yes gene_type:complete